MFAFGQARLGRDAELRTLADGGVVASLALAFDRRDKGAKVTDWVEGALWGKRAEALAPYLKKGGTLTVTLEDLHSTTYTNKEGVVVAKLVGRVVGIELGSSPAQDRPAAHPPAPRPPSPAPRPAASFSDDMDPDVPF